MATKLIAHLVDDLDGTVLDEGEGTQMTFSIDGRDYEIDLSRRNADKFYRALTPFVDAARPARSAAPSGRSGTREPRGSSGLDLGAVREWARAQGMTVNDRGRLPATVIEAYSAANS
ncbi:histone-like nucleoid-structuring protein Lsr2 [Microbacterium sp. LMI1-1-1.1]|uniref:histone-like nucleoid-structuring protein Lsr2 n=1 Tax=unclassified Microbacterium TaxID=2609290 RepID=UPI003464F9E3